ncbi:hypothetical protein [Streptomyces dengpaensis]|nr:hypothetical protein [Streptomyces dengpaensis]
MALPAWPDDALTVVDAPTLLVPGQAPWLTVPDLVGYLPVEL